MKSIQLVRCSFALALIPATLFAQSQGGGGQEQGSGGAMSLQSGQTQSTSTEKSTTASDGFWMFPEPAPLTGPIATDRPGFSDTASLVPRGHIQIESGYTYSYDDEHHRKVNSNTVPELAFRTGLTDWLEFRAQWAGYNYSQITDRITTPAGRRVNDTQHEQTALNLNLGVKVAILKQDGWKPNLSVIPSLYVPTGSGASSNNVVPELKFPWNYAITKEFTVYGSVLGRVPDPPGGSQFYQTAVTLAGAYQVMERVKVYTEYYGLYKPVQGQDCLHLLSAGPIIQITENLSLDTRLAVGLNEQAPDFQASIGFGIRF